MNPTHLFTLVVALSSTVLAQPDLPSKVPISFDRYYDTAQLNQHLRAIAAAYPDLVTLKTIGKSIEGRDMLVAIVNNPRTGPDTARDCPSASVERYRTCLEVTPATGALPMGSRVNVLAREVTTSPGAPGGSAAGGV